MTLIHLLLFCVCTWSPSYLVRSLEDVEAEVKKPFDAFKLVGESSPKNTSAQRKMGLPERSEPEASFVVSLTRDNCTVGEDGKSAPMPGPLTFEEYMKQLEEARGVADVPAKMEIQKEQEAPESGLKAFENIVHELVPDKIADNLGVHTATSAIVGTYFITGIIVLIVTAIRYVFTKDLRRSLLLIQHSVAFHLKGTVIAVYSSRLSVIFLYFFVIYAFSMTAGTYKGFQELQRPLYSLANIKANIAVCSTQIPLWLVRMIFIMLIYVFGSVIFVLGSLEYWLQYLHNICYGDKNLNFTV